VRFDIFLSSLLFGITLLTCALAIMHLLCDGLLNSSQFPPLARRKIRMLLLGSTISVSLLIFLVRLCTDLSGGDLFSWGFDAEHGIFPRRIARIETVPRPTTPLTPDFRIEGTWTLYSKPTRELKIQKLQGLNLGLFSRGVFVWAPPKPGVICNTWTDRLRSLGVEPHVFKNLSALPPGALVVACPGLPPQGGNWDKLREHVFAGGSLLALGNPSNDGADTIRAMTRIIAFHETDAKQPVKVVLGGPRLTWGGFPSGLRVFFGGTPEFHHEMALAEVAAGFSESYAVREEYDKSDAHMISAPKLSALVSADYGRGRVVWAGVPAKLFGKPDLLWGQAWEVLGQRLIAHLLQAPQAGLELWPDGNSAPVVIATHSEANPELDLALERELRPKKIHLSHYTILSEAQERKRHFARLLASDEDIGMSEPDHMPVADLDFFERYDRVKKWLAGYLDLPRNESTALSGDQPGKLNAALGADRHITGALTIGGVNAFPDQYAALMANRLSYAVLDPYGDQISPLQVHLVKTSELVNFLSEGKSLEDAPTARSLILAPHRAMDDASLIGTAGGLTESTEIRRLAQEQYRFSQWAGGPHLFRISTGGNGLGTEENFPLLGKIIDSFREDGASFMTAEEVVQFWKSRSETDIMVEPLDRSRVPTDLDHLADDGTLPQDAADPAHEDWEDSSSSTTPLSHISKSDLAFRITVTNGGTEPLKRAVLRLTEPENYRALVRKGDVDQNRSLSETNVVRVIRVKIPDLRPGETYALWLVHK